MILFFFLSGKFFFQFSWVCSVCEISLYEVYICTPISTHSVVYGTVTLLLDAPDRNPTNTLISANEAFPADYSEEKDMHRVETRTVS